MDRDVTSHPLPTAKAMDNLDRIQFAKPDLAKLIENHTVVDLHFHSRYSDGINSIEKIAQRAEQLGIGIAITDHNEIQGAIAISKFKDILSIPGIEITSREGSHLLVYFYEIKELRRFYRKDIVPYMGNGVMSSLALTMEEVIMRAKKYHAVIIFPHPFCAAYTGICNLQFPKERLQILCEMADGIEVINAGNINKWNLKCTVFGFNLNKAMVGGSDGHSLGQMGRAVTYADCPGTRNAFLDAIKEGHNKVVGKEIDFLRKFTSNGLKMRRNIRNYPDLFEKNIKYSYVLIHSTIDSTSRLIKDRLKNHFSGKRRKFIQRNALEI